MGWAGPGLMVVHNDHDGWWGGLAQGRWLFTMTMMAGGVGWSRVGGVTMTMMAGGVMCSRVGGRHIDHDGWWGGLVQG